MFKFSKNDLIDESGVQVGYSYKYSGEISYGIEEDEILELKRTLEDLDSDTESEVVIIDFSELDHWDSLGITVMVPKLLKVNKQLKNKGRPLVTIIGDRNADIYRAARDKFGDRINQEDLPWLESVDSFLNQF